MNEHHSLVESHGGPLSRSGSSIDFQEPQQEELDLQNYWRVIRKHLWSILGLAFSVAVLTYLIQLTMTPIYKATSSLIIEPKARQKVISIDEVVGLDAAGAEYFMTQIEVLKSQSIARRVIEKLPPELKGLENPAQVSAEPESASWREWIKENVLPDWINDLMVQSDGGGKPLTVDPIDKLAGQILGGLTITPIRSTHIIQISFEDPNPERAMRVANLIGVAYIEMQQEARQGVTEQSARWLADRVEKLRADLLISEKQLTDYMESEGLINLTQGGGDAEKASAGVMSLSAGELSDRQSKLNEAHRKRVELETLYGQVASFNGKYPENIATLPGIYEDAGVQALKAQEHEALAQLKQVESKYGVQHPDRRAAQSRVDSLRAALQRQVGVAVAGLRNQLEAARANESALSKGFEQSKGKVQEISRKDSRLNELRREVETNRNLYELFFNRLKETTETRDLSATNATILDQAQPPTAPFKPQKKKITLLAGLLALLGGIGLAFLLEQLDTSLKSPEEIEEKLGIPFLGLLPFDQLTSDGKVLSYEEDSLSSFAEAVRSIRTGLIFGTLNHPRPIVMVTSASPGEGKTTAILNMACSMAQLKRVLLIEADLRKPEIGKRLNLPLRSPGICNLIVGDEEFSHCIFPLRENLDVIPSGRIPPNPLEMLSAPRFAELLAKFREEYDMVIIDSPPVGPVSDPIVLSRLTDAVLFVVRAQKSQVKQVQQAISRLRRVQAPLTGIILNFADVMRERYYKYHYHHYYQYGYGYGEYKSSKEEAEACANTVPESARRQKA
jgi:capsular exopolysaccharide synthesis family protein